jgi:hypothetical protein
MAAGLMPMAKAKRSRGKEAPPDPGAGKGDRKPTVLAMKGSPEWKAWLDRAADHCRLSASTLVDLAVAEYVKARGFTEPPPKR